VVFAGCATVQEIFGEHNKLANCAVFAVRLATEHACKPTLLHLLIKYSGLRKLAVELGSRMVRASN
jgi:hypothetical protein